MRRLAVLVSAAALLLSASACTDSSADGGSGTVITIGADSGPLAWLGSDTKLTQVETSKLVNPLDPCKYVDETLATLIEGEGTKDSSGTPIEMKKDGYSPTRNVPVRRCISAGDEGLSLTATVLRDEPGKNVGYNSVAAFYELTNTNSLDSSKLPVQKGFYVEAIGQLLGAVFKTERDTVVIFQFGTPVTDRAGLDEMIRQACLNEAAFYDEAIKASKGAKVLPQPVPSK